MVYFTKTQLESLTQEAAYEGRESELRVLLGPNPLIRKYTYQLAHKKNGIEHDLILLNETKTIVEGVISTIEKVPSLEDPRATAISIAQIHLKDISLGDRISLSASTPSTSPTASAASPTESQALIVLNESRTLIPHPSHSHESKLDWTVNPHAIYHIHEKYVQSRIREQQHLIEVTLANKKASTEEVITELRDLVRDLSGRIKQKDAECGELKKQIEEKKREAEKTYEEHANGWFEQIKQIIRERLPHTLTEISIEDKQPDEQQIELAEKELDKHVSPKIRRKIITELKAQQQSRPIPIPGAKTDSTTALEQEESLSLLDALKKAKVDINLIDSQGNSLVALAMHPSSRVEPSTMLAIIEYLSQGGAELEYPDNNGVTPARKALGSRDRLGEINQNALIKVVAERKIQDLEYPLHPDIAWYLERQQALKDEGPRRVKAHAEKYLEDRKERENAKKNVLYRAWRAGYELIFENEDISKSRLGEAEWLSERSSKTLLDGDHKSYTHDVRFYKDKHAKFGRLRGEDGSDLWKETLAAISDMELEKYGDREVAVTYLDSIEHRSLKATVQKLELEREEDRAKFRKEIGTLEAKIDDQDKKLEDKTKKLEDQTKKLEDQTKKLEDQTKNIDAIIADKLAEQNKNMDTRIENAVASALSRSQQSTTTASSYPSTFTARMDADDRREAATTAGSIPRNFHRDGTAEEPAPTAQNGNEGEPRPPSPTPSTRSLGLDMDM